MSEYQRVSFRALDCPVQGKDLEFMRAQSSRAEVTPWSFDNEYHFGDFRGDAFEMMRRGYDFHLHYANFGVRTLQMRLPHGLPDAMAAAAYLEDESVRFVKDKKGLGGTLVFDPTYEPGQLEEVYDLDEMLERLMPLRAEILDGDLRPLYLACVAVAFDMNHAADEMHEPPIPAGLEKLTSAQRALADFYGLSGGIMAAAAAAGPALPRKANAESSVEQWLATLSQATKDAWLVQCMSDAEAGVRSEMLAAFRKAQGVPTWPTAATDRTLADLLKAGNELDQEFARQAKEKAAAERKRKLAAMAADPSSTLAETEKLVQQRSTRAYSEIAARLAELREALGDSKQAQLADQQARKLMDKNPTRKMLIAALRRQGFAKK